MKAGNWVPMDKRLVRALPKNRAFTELEASFSTTLDYDSGNAVTISGYARQWGWSRGKVERFLEEIGVVVQYPDNTGQKQNQRGQIMIQNASRTRAENGQIKIIDSKWLASETNRKRADNGQITGRSQGTTINLEPDPNPEPKKTSCPKPKRPSSDPSRFGQFWDAYPNKKAKAPAEKAWLKVNPDQALFDTIIAALEKQKNSATWQRDGGQFIPHPATWLNGHRWEDIIETETRGRARDMWNDEQTKEFLSRDEEEEGGQSKWM